MPICTKCGSQNLKICSDDSGKCMDCGKAYISISQLRDENNRTIEAKMKGGDEQNSDNERQKRLTRDQTKSGQPTTGRSTTITGGSRRKIFQTRINDLIRKLKNWKIRDIPEELSTVVFIPGTLVPLPMIVTATEENTEEMIPPAIGGWFIASFFIVCGIIILCFSMLTPFIYLGLLSIGIGIVLIWYGLTRKSRSKK